MIKSNKVVVAGQAEESDEESPVPLRKVPLQKQRSAGTLPIIHSPLLSRQRSLSSKRDDEDKEEKSLLQIKLIEKNHSLLRNLESFTNIDCYGKAAKETDKLLYNFSTTRMYFQDSVLAIRKTLEIYKDQESKDALDQFLTIGDSIVLPSH